LSEHDLHDLWIIMILESSLRGSYQGSTVEATVALKLIHGTIPKTGCIRFRGSFFGYFFGEAKK